MTIAQDYLAIIHRIAESVELPPIRQMHIACDADSQGKSSKFGAMVLDDDTVGLTYVGLNGALHDLCSRPECNELIGCSPVEAALLFAGEAGWQRSLGMAAVNAISQFVIKRSGLTLTESAKTMDLVGVESSDHIGMVGYFPPLVEQIRALNVPLTVIELDKKWQQREDGFEVTLDPTRLSLCNKILCTGTTLVNHTLDAVLAHSGGAEMLLLVGPTVGCLPDPLFQRGVTVVGGCQVVDRPGFVELWQNQQRWRQATRRYSISTDRYPGFEALL